MPLVWPWWPRLPGYLVAPHTKRSRRSVAQASQSGVRGWLVVAMLAVFAGKVATSGRNPYDDTSHVVAAKGPPLAS